MAFGRKNKNNNNTPPQGAQGGLRPGQNPMAGGPRPPMQPNGKPMMDPRVQNGSVQPAGKPKKPVTKVTVIGLSALVAFILLLLFSVALIFASMVRSANDQAAYQQLLMDAENTVREASINVAFSPAESIREKALAPSVNLAVIRKQGANTTIANGDNANTNPKSDDTQANKDAQARVQQQQQQPQQPAQQPAPQAPANPAADNDNALTYGSGVLISQNKDTYYILTNNHVVQNAIKITATINGAEYEADMTGYDPLTDLAVIQITAKDLTLATIGSSAAVKTGDFTMSIGNPYGLNDSMSTGVISGLGRNLKYEDNSVSIMYANMIQTDTPINPGNSGGGLFNATGELIGINTLITTNDSHSDTIGYAIPIDFAIPIAQDLLAGKTASHASFGIGIDRVPQDQIDKYGLANGDGAYIISVTPSGPAETCGIVPGDIIVSYRGEEVKDPQDLLYKIRASVINDQNEVKILREGKEMTFTIKIGSDV